MDRTSSPLVLVVGDITADVMASLDTTPVTGGDCLASKLEFHSGGVGGNTALCLARWGCRVRLLGRVGRDWFGDFVLGCAQRDGVDLSYVQRDEEAMTGLFFIAVSPDGQRTMFGSRAANARLAAPENLPACLASVQAAHLAGYCFLSESAAQVAETLLREAAKKGLPVSLDAADAPSRSVPSAILQAASKVDTLFSTQAEAEAITGRKGAQQALAALEESGVKEVILKRGARGCLIREEDGLVALPAFPVRAADSTGAGDAFDAAFLRARLHGWPRKDAALLANAAGAAAASVVGAGEQLPGPAKVLDLLRRARLPAPWDEHRQRILERLQQELPHASEAAR